MHTVWSKVVLPRIIVDHLGSIRVVLTETENVDSWSDYYPFGKEARGGYLNNKSKEGYSNYQFDSEIFLSYAGGRYYDNNICKWVSVDPQAGKGAWITPYNFNFNNPISFIDKNGEWPEKFHNILIDQAFANIYSNEELRILKNASTNTDKKYQQSSESYRHAMRARGQSKDNAIEEANKFISKSISRYNNFNNIGDKESALYVMGEVMHLIMDLTAPSHKGFQPWGGIVDYASYPIIHGTKEGSILGFFYAPFLISQERENTTVKIMQQVEKWFKSGTKFTINSIEVDDSLVDVEKLVKQYQDMGYKVIVDGKLRE